MVRAVPYALLLLSLAGCRRESVIERAARQYREKQESRIALAQLETARFETMTDAQMVAANTMAGLAVALRAQKTALHVGEPLRLHLVYEDFGAAAPVSATTCQGFSLSVEDEMMADAASAALTFSCLAADPSRDNGTELRRGELRHVDLSTADTAIHFDHPGRYIVTSEWRTFEPSAGTLVLGLEYATVTSNPVLVTVR
jgi:hypothetical protein